MPTPTYTPLANITLGATSTLVTFGSIPATARDLICVITMVSSNTSFTRARLRLNGDTGSNYTWQGMKGTGSTAQQFTGSNNYAYFGDTHATNVQRIQYEVSIMDYSATDKHKTVLVRADQAAVGTEALVNRWANTAAVTSVTLIPSGNAFGVGSTFALYEVIA
jgi:hypothetical protein